MPTVNITPATKKMAEDVEMYVDFDTIHLDYDDDDTEVSGIYIGDDNSDFMIFYCFNDDGSLQLLRHPSYVTELPKRISSSVELRKMVKYAVKRCQEES